MKHTLLTPELRSLIYERVGSGCKSEVSRKLYSSAIFSFLNWCEETGYERLRDLTSSGIELWLQALATQYSVSTIKLRLAAVRKFFDWLIENNVCVENIARQTQGPLRTDKTSKSHPVSLQVAESIIDSIPSDTICGLRDRALIATIVNSLAPIGVILNVKLSDVRQARRQFYIAFYGRSSNSLEYRCDHKLSSYLRGYLSAADLAAGSDGYLFRTIGRGTDVLSANRLPHSNVYAMVKRRARAAGLKTMVSPHSLRAAGISDLLKSDDTGETIARMANFSSPRSARKYA